MHIGRSILGAWFWYSVKKILMGRYNSLIFIVTIHISDFISGISFFIYISYIFCAFFHFSFWIFHFWKCLYLSAHLCNNLTDSRIVGSVSLILEFAVGEYSESGKTQVFCQLRALHLYLPCLCQAHVSSLLYESPLWYKLNFYYKTKHYM